MGNGRVSYKGRGAGRLVTKGPGGFGGGGVFSSIRSLALCFLLSLLFLSLGLLSLSDCACLLLFFSFVQLACCVHRTRARLLAASPRPNFKKRIRKKCAAVLDAINPFAWCENKHPNPPKNKNPNTQHAPGSLPPPAFLFCISLTLAPAPFVPFPRFVPIHRCAPPSLGQPQQIHGISTRLFHFP